jgi:hypothetical protein
MVSHTALAVRRPARYPGRCCGENGLTLMNSYRDPVLLHSQAFPRRVQSQRTQDWAWLLAVLENNVRGGVTKR